MSDKRLGINLGLSTCEPSVRFRILQYGFHKYAEIVLANHMPRQPYYWIKMSYTNLGPSISTTCVSRFSFRSLSYTACRVMMLCTSLSIGRNISNIFQLPSSNGFNGESKHDLVIKSIELRVSRHTRFRKIVPLLILTIRERTDNSLIINIISFSG